MRVKKQKRRPLADLNSTHFDVDKDYEIPPFDKSQYMIDEQDIDLNEDDNTDNCDQEAKKETLKTLFSFTAPKQSEINHNLAMKRRNKSIMSNVEMHNSDLKNYDGD